MDQQLTLIPPGKFMMGNHETPETSAKFAAEIGDVNSRPENYRDEQPRHLVTITQAFYLSTFEVTRGEFRTFVRDTQYRTDAERDGKGGLGYSQLSRTVEQHPDFSWQNPGYKQTDDHPVVNVTWNDATEFCRWLSMRESKQYRLPTEAEWEYACRAGTGGRTTAGNIPAAMENEGNVGDISCQRIPGFSSYTGLFGFDDGHSFTAPVGQYRKNPFGLHDMHGNVWEWCHDFYDADYYRTSPDQNPTGPETGEFRIYRGGGWMNGPAGCRSSRRGGPSPVSRCNRLGFRVALQLTPEPQP
jgi:formylglycine-generating enzyme required for sulfatase activity